MKTCSNQQTCDNHLDLMRNRLLLFFYGHQYAQAIEMIDQVIHLTSQADTFNENDQKRIHQIRVMVRRFYRAGNGPDFFKVQNKLKAQLNTISHHLVRINRSETHDIQYIEFSAWKNKLDLPEKSLSLIFKTLINLQLTTGCSHFCRRCNEWALPGVRKHFSFDAVKMFVSLIEKENPGEITPYAASDPLDWQEGERSITDIIDLFKSKNIPYSLLSKVPKGSEHILNQLVENRANISISITKKNKLRVEKLLAQISQDIKDQTDHTFGIQHDTNDLMIAACQDEDFTTIKSSITDSYGVEITPDGAFIVIPTFTSALYPFGHQKIRVTKDTWFFPEKKVGRDALLVDYFKPLKGYDLHQNTCCLEHLMDVQIETLLLDNGSYDLAPPGMRSLNEYLEIFDDAARKRRKSMTLSVMRHLKKEHLKNGSYRSKRPDEIRHYRKKVQRHLDLCKQDFCCEAKKDAIAFFLKEAAEFTQQHPNRTRIIRYLLKEEMHTLYNNKEPGNLPGFDPEISFAEQGDHCFASFRHALFCLIRNCDLAPIHHFIDARPCIYDPDADLFIKKGQPSYPDT